MASPSCSEELDSRTFGRGIVDLPEEILEYILSHLTPYQDLISTKLVCKLWQRVSNGILRKKSEEFQKAIITGPIDLKILPTPIPPTITSRHSHCSCYHDKAMYVFGGCTSPNATFNDLWRFDLASREWARPLTKGFYPSPKACSSMVVWNDSLVLFGGWSHPTPYPLHQAARFFSELNIYTPETNMWDHMVTHPSPPPTAGHSASILNNTMVIFGGSHGHNNSCNDLWVLDLVEESWKKIETSDPQPQPRYGQSQFSIGDKYILIIGGCGGPNMVFNDVWLLETGSQWKWREVRVQGTAHIPPLFWCRQACKIGDYIVTIRRGPKPNSKTPTKRTLSGRNTLLRPPPCVYSSSDTDSSESADEHNGPNHRPRFRRPGPRGHAPQHVQRESQRPGTANFSPHREGLPSIRPNAMNNRERQLEMLRRYEERIRNRVDLHGGDDSQRVPPGGNCINTLYVHTIDVRSVITNNELTWLPPTECDCPTNSSNEETLFYSLVKGRAELIMFGGLLTDPNSMQVVTGPSSIVVTNELLTLNPVLKFY